MLALLLGTALAQTTQITPPPQCTRQCQQFNLTACRQPTPQNDQQWKDTIQKLSECICPIVLRNQNSCGACLNTNAPDSSIYYSQLASKCVQRTVGEEIALLWDLKQQTATTSAVSPSQTGSKPPGPTGGAFAMSLSIVALIPLFFL